MILSDKPTFWIKPGLAALLIPFFFACDDPTELGLELENNQNDFTVHKEVLVLPSSSIYIDSLRTDQFDNQLVFGQYEDSIGKSSVTSYLQYAIGGGTLPDDSLDFSTAYLILRVENTRVNGAVPGEQIRLHETNDTLYSSAVYLRHRSLEYAEETVADHSFDFNPASDTILKIPLTASFGSSLFTKLELAGTDDDYRDSLIYSRYFYPPLAMVPGSSNQALYTFNLADDTTGIYIEMQNPEGEKFYYTFNLTSNHFYQVDRYQADGQPRRAEESYTEQGPSGKVYLDVIAGIYPKLDLQPYKAFIESHDDIMINGATLSFGALNNSADYIGFPQAVQSFFIKDNGKINGPGVATGQNFNNAMLTDGSYVSSGGTTLLSMSFDEEELSYSGNVTLFSQVLFDTFKNDSSYLTSELVLLNSNWIDLGQSTFSSSDITLTIYYTATNE